MYESWRSYFFLRLLVRVFIFVGIVAVLIGFFYPWLCIWLTIVLVLLVVGILYFLYKRHDPDRQYASQGRYARLNEPYRSTMNDTPPSFTVRRDDQRRPHEHYTRPRSPTEPLPAKHVQEPRCPHCGTVLGPKASSCWQCGKMYGWWCHACRSPLNEGAVFCSNCGTRPDQD
jgi:hypothetical protein